MLNERVLEGIRAKFLRWGGTMPRDQLAAGDGHRRLRKCSTTRTAGARHVPRTRGPHRRPPARPAARDAPDVRDAGAAEARGEGRRRARRPPGAARLRPRRVGRRRRIAPVYTQYKNPQTTILFNRSEIEIHLTAQGKTEQEAELLLDGLAGQIEERLGESIFAFRGETLEEVVGLRLAVSGFTLAVAESCTGGLVAERSRTCPAHQSTSARVVAYSNESKVRLLGVPST